MRENRSYNDKSRYNQSNYKQKYAKMYLPKDYLCGGYYYDKEKKMLKKEYIVEYSKSIANSLEQEAGRDVNKRSQIRRFYEYVRRIEKSMLIKKCDFKQYESDLYELAPHVHYAKSRKLISDIFVEFIEKNLENIKDEKDLRAFSRHFEAIVAYMKKES